MTAPRPCPPRPLRADAVRNRERVLCAARELFAQRGLDVTMDDVARHAGLGVGTVYRRFADREALVEELFGERLQLTADLARRCLADPDPWHGLVGLLLACCEELAGDKGLRQVMLSSAYGQDRLATARRELVPLVVQLVARAQAAGAVRPDVEPADVPVLFLLVGTVAEFTSCVAPQAWRRTFQLLLDGLRPAQHPDAVPLRPGLTLAELDVAMADYRPAAPLRGVRTAPPA